MAVIHEPPTVAATRERVGRLANEAMFTVALQLRRLASDEPEDDAFVMRWWADLQFLIIALRRLRNVSEVLTGVPAVAQAIARFDEAVPNLLLMRNVGEHLDAYAVDSPDRHRRHVDRRQLEVGEWDGRVYRWLRDAGGELLDLDVYAAREAAERLHASVMGAARTP